MTRQVPWMLLALALTSGACAPVVYRWTLGGKERAGGVLPIVTRPNIFADFLWTTPPITSQQLEFNGPVARLTFAGEKLAIIRDADGGLTLARGGTRQSAQRQVSAQDRYFNVEELGTKLVSKQRLVTRSRLVQRMESVTKTRMVSKTVPVQRSRQVSLYNSSTHSTSYRTEYYTAYEPQMVSESYMAQEMRSRWENYTVWETVMERVVDIPTYEYYEFPWGEGARILVYEVPRSDGTADYFLQNPTYLTGHDTEQALMDGAVSVLSIDANSNGIYFEDDDRLLFNSWNPYREDSAFQEVPGFMDNRWYRLSELLNQHLLRVGPSADLLAMEFASPNARFKNITKRGRLKITNVPATACAVVLNGAEYHGDRNGVLDANIEYGVYQLRIVSPGLVDYTEVFTVDESQPNYTLAYQPTRAAGMLNIQNVSVTKYKVLIQKNGGLVAVYEDAPTVFLPEGQYDVIIASGGYEVAWNVRIHPDVPATVDYDAEVRIREGLAADAQPETAP